MHNKKDIYLSVDHRVLSMCLSSLQKGGLTLAHSMPLINMSLIYTSSFSLADNNQLIFMDHTENNIYSDYKP